jgi:regulator of protease activity HflC (stomatin/prohibitin superfamily)
MSDSTFYVRSNVQTVERRASWFMMNNPQSRYQPNNVNPNAANVMPATNGVGCALFLVLALIGALISLVVINPPVAPGADFSFWLKGLAPFVVFGLIGYLIFLSLRIARQWEKAIVLRLGKFSHTSGPGIFFLWPIIDSISSIVDTRVQITPFKAEQTLSRDTVPVDVDAVLFWFVWDAEKAAMAVSNYAEAVSWAAQTALRDTIGKTDLASLLAGREQIEMTLKKMIDDRTEPWGITVQSVEMRDVLIPEALQDAMSKEAQAERERHARVILSQAEVEVAQKFNQAALIYGANPVAMSLRSMNMLSDAIKERGALVVVPNNAVETLGLGTITGLSALTQNMLPNAPQIATPVEPANGHGIPNQNQMPDPSAPVPQQRRQPPQQPGNPAPYNPWPQTGPRP